MPGVAGQYTDLLAQAVLAMTVVPWGVGKVLGKPAADTARVGGLVALGLTVADKFLPNFQSQLVGFVQRPISPAPAAVPVQGSGLGDVYDVDMQAAGFGGFADVEDVDMSQFQ